MTKPYDFSKFRKSITKSIDGISVGFNQTTEWISTGNYLLNYLISGDFKKGIPLGKVSTFSGQPASGKSFLCSGNIVKNAQQQGIFVVLIDTENALDEPWLQALGVDTSDEKLLKLNMAMIDDVAKTISEFMKEYKAMDPKPKVLFVIDSLGMLLTPTDTQQFSDGNLKGNMGIKPKALAALVRNCVNMFGTYNVGLVATNHSYASQSMYDSDDIISGGLSFIYASSIVVAMQKFKLKEDEEGNKVTDVKGIRSKCKIMKSRFTQPYQEIEIRIPWDTGMDPYSGMFDYLEKKKFITKDGMKYTYTDLSGNIHKYYRKDYLRNTNNIYDLIMDEFDDKLRLSKDNDDALENIDTLDEEPHVE